MGKVSISIAISFFILFSIIISLTPEKDTRSIISLFDTIIRLLSILALLKYLIQDSRKGA